MISDEIFWELQVARAGGHLRLQPKGDLDLETAPLLLAEVERRLAAGESDVVIDLTGLTFVDSTGLGTLVGCWRRAQKAGATLALANPNPDVWMTLEITGLNKVLPLRVE